MNEQLEARIGSILSDPQQMERLQAVAQSLLGAPAADKPQETEAAPPLPEGLMGLLGKASSGGSESERLLRAMQPYMRPKRRSKIDRALKLTRLIGLAETMLEHYGGELDGL